MVITKNFDAAKKKWRHNMRLAQEERARILRANKPLIDGRSEVADQTVAAISSAGPLRVCSRSQSEDF